MLQPDSHTTETGEAGETQVSVPASHLLVLGQRSRRGGLLSRRPRPSALPKFKAVLDELTGSGAKLWQKESYCLQEKVLNCCSVEPNQCRSYRR